MKKGTGFLWAVVRYWRRIFAPSRAEELRILAQQHADDLRRLQQRLDEAAAQIRDVHAQNARLAACYTAARADFTRGVGNYEAAQRQKGA